MLEVKDMVDEHVQTITIKTVMVIPSHSHRSESPEFRKTKQTLRKDGNLSECWLCGSKQELEVHHFFAEWCEGSIIDFEVLKDLCNKFDIYGYAKKNQNAEITSIDTILQMMTLCKSHHTGTDSTDGGSPTGIHELPFGEWILQKVAKISPIPQEGETIGLVEEKIKEFTDKEVFHKQNK